MRHLLTSCLLAALLLPPQAAWACSTAHGMEAYLYYWSWLLPTAPGMLLGALLYGARRWRGAALTRGHLLAHILGGGLALFLAGLLHVALYPDAWMATKSKCCFDAPPRVTSEVRF